MNYFMSLAILAVAVTFLATLAHGQQQFPGNYKRTIGCSKKLDVYKPNSNRQWPSKARNIKFKISSPKQRLLLTVEWIANTTNMNGFKIIVKSTNRPDICIIYDYTDTVKNYPLGVYSFSVALKMHERHRHRNFTGLLFPLPSSDNASQFVAFHTRISIDCSNYITYFYREYDGRNLHVTVYKAPDECNFKEYEIQLLKNEKIFTNKIIPTKANVRKLETTMELNICRGKYKILVSPYDRYFNDKSRCVCKDVEKLCRSCTYSWDKMYLVPAKRCLRDTASSKTSLDKSELYLFQFLFGLLLLFLLVLAIAYWKYNFLTPNRGIVLFMDDHETHTNAVTKLVDYMNTYNLRVSLASAFLTNSDTRFAVMTEAVKSDFILLVLSNALQKRMEAWDKQQDYAEFFKEVNSNILTKQFMEMLMACKKLRVCKFDHVAGFGHWPKPCYSLPTDLTRMTMDLSGRSCCRSLFKCWKSHSLSIELKKGIQKSFLYEQSHENWFQEKYHNQQML